MSRAPALSTRLDLRTGRENRLDRRRRTRSNPAHGGQPATFEFSADGAQRATISLSLESMGPRFAVADLRPLNEQRLAALQADALKKLGGTRPVYMESVTIGAQPFVRQAGAHAVEVRVRDVAEDSVHANYAWIAYDFGGRIEVLTIAPAAAGILTSAEQRGACRKLLLRLRNRQAVLSCLG